MEYYCMKQLQKYFPDIEFEFHIVLDDIEYEDEWSIKILELPYVFHWYSKQEMIDYGVECGYFDREFESKINNFVHFYHILIFHYLRRVLRYDYALAYEFDIIFNSFELTELEHVIKNKIPFGICEPLNASCDKALVNQIGDMFGFDLIKSLPTYGVNAGFQGMNLKLFDNFLNPEAFKNLLDCFDFSGIKNDDGTEKTGWTRTIIDTQEQSFHSIMNVLSPGFVLLNPNNYYFYPYWTLMDMVLKSKVIHYFGHEKPKIMMDTIDERLKQWEDNG